MLPRTNSTTVLLLAFGLYLCTGCGGPQTTAEYIELAGERFNRGNHSSALRLCNTAIDLEPDSFDAYSLRAIVHQGMGNRKQSIADWTKAIQLAPDDGTKSAMYTFRSYVYESMGDRLSMAKDRVEAKTLELNISDRP